MNTPSIITANNANKVSAFLFVMVILSAGHRRILPNPRVIRYVESAATVWEVEFIFVFAFRLEGNVASLQLVTLVRLAAGGDAASP
jgi:hypothetical protein